MSMRRSEDARRAAREARIQALKAASNEVWSIYFIFQVLYGFFDMFVCFHVQLNAMLTLKYFLVISGTGRCVCVWFIIIVFFFFLFFL